MCIGKALNSCWRRRTLMARGVCPAGPPSFRSTLKAVFHTYTTSGFPPWRQDGPPQRSLWRSMESKEVGVSDPPSARGRALILPLEKRETPPAKRGGEGVATPTFFCKSTQKESQ